jgi:hypothetical protein
VNQTFFGFCTKFLLIAKVIILGLTEHSSAQGTINNVLIILKYYIYVCRCKCRDPDLEGELY